MSRRVSCLVDLKPIVESLRASGAWTRSMLYNIPWRRPFLSEVLRVAIVPVVFFASRILYAISVAKEKAQCNL